MWKRRLVERVERGRHNVGLVNLRRIAGALDMSLSKLFAEIESQKGSNDS